MIETISLLHVALIVFVWAVAALRWIFLRSDREHVRLNVSLTFGAVNEVIKDPTLAHFVVPELGATPIWAITHFLFTLGLASLIGMCNSWTYGDAEPRWLQPSLYLAALIIGRVMLELSTISGPTGTPIEVVGGWQAIVYCILICIPPFGLAFVAARHLSNWREARSLRATLTIAGVALVIIVIVVDALLMLALAVLTTYGIGQEFALAKANSNGSFLPMLMFVATVVAAVPLVRRILAVIRERRGRRTLGDVHRLWRVLTAAVPDIVLESGRRGLSRRQRRLRMIAEIYDAITVLDAYAEPIVDGRWDSQLTAAGLAADCWDCVYRAAQMQTAIERRSLGADPIEGEYPAVIRPSDPVSALARYARLDSQWDRARDLRLGEASISLPG